MSYMRKSAEIPKKVRFRRCGLDAYESLTDPVY